MRHTAWTAHRLALALAVFPLGACVSSVEGKSHAQEDPNAVAAGAPADGKSVAGGTSSGLSAAEKKKAKKAEQRARELSYAQLQLQIDELSAQSEERAAKEELEETQRALEEEKRELERFLSHEKVHKVDEAKLDIDRATQRAREAEEELKEMEATFAKDQFAATTKELVLMRHRKSVEFAQRDLELEKRTLVDLESAELPKSQREHEKSVREAEEELRKAEVALKKSALEHQIELEKSRRKVEELSKPEEEGEKGDKDAKQGQDEDDGEEEKE